MSRRRLPARAYSLRIAIVCAISITLAACGGSGATTQPLAATGPATTPVSPSPASARSSPPGASTTARAATPPIAEQLSSELIGTWTSDISDADVSVIQQHAPGFDKKGTWTMDLSATTFQFLNPEGDSPGPYPVRLSRTNEITVAPELDCPDQNSTVDGGQYTYKIVGTSMTLTSVRDDSCPFRQWLLISHPWQRKA